jgi:chitin disaccharide deacetylase
MKLLFESDDYGITDGVTCGILKGIRQGLIRNTGLFVNMPSSAFAAQQIKQFPECCLGIDFNLVAGNPVTQANKIPALAKASGEFFTSTEMRVKAGAKPTNSMNEEMQVDPYPLDQTMLEIENQYLRFLELVGKKPGYLHGHSFMTSNIIKAILSVSEKYDVPTSFGLWEKMKMHFITNTWNVKPFPVELQLKTNVEGHVLNVIHEAVEHELSILICHAGFVDEELFQYSTYTLIREKDLYMACSLKLVKYLEEHNISLVTYEDLIKE